IARVGQHRHGAAPLPHQTQQRQRRALRTRRRGVSAYLAREVRDLAQQHGTLSAENWRQSIFRKLDSPSLAQSRPHRNLALVGQHPSHLLIKLLLTAPSSL